MEKKPSIRIKILNISFFSGIFHNSQYFTNEVSSRTIYCIYTELNMLNIYTTFWIYKQDKKKYHGVWSSHDPLSGERPAQRSTMGKSYTDKWIIIFYSFILCGCCAHTHTHTKSQFIQKYICIWITCARLLLRAAQFFFLFFFCKVHTTSERTADANTIRINVTNLGTRRSLVKGCTVAGRSSVCCLRI